MYLQVPRDAVIVHAEFSEAEQRFDVLLAPGQEVVDADHLVLVQQQPLTQM